jgi:hypothetical protein
MFALLHKKVFKEKRHHQYWVNPLLCSRLETGQSQMTGNCSISFVSNQVSNYSRGDCFDIFKNSDLDDNTASRSEYCVVDLLVETAQLFTKPLTQQRGTKQLLTATVKP